MLTHYRGKLRGNGHPASPGVPASVIASILASVAASVPAERSVRWRSHFRCSLHRSRARHPLDKSPKRSVPALLMVRRPHRENCPGHELSIVHGIVTTVTESLIGRHVSQVYSVKLNVGALSGVVEDALQFSYGIATEGSILAGSRIEVVHIPVRVYCAECQLESELPSLRSFRCIQCGTPSRDIRSGRKLDIESLEIDKEPATPPASLSN